MIKDVLISMWRNARNMNNENIFTLLEKNNAAKFLDLGCDDGDFTLKIATIIGTKYIYGVDVVDERLEAAKKKGIKTSKADINQKLPFPNDSFDIVHANQVIEHLVDTDNFAEEIYRILKPNGYAIISTENLSSWHNIAALTLGRQAFSQHISSKYHIGNEFSPHDGEKMGMQSWTHVKIFTYFGLREFFRVHGFKIDKIKGAGYHPFQNLLSKAFSRIDPIHAPYITIKVSK